ncbi:hypothetical protein V6N11_070375 [Hibiscus sabdariffa]|uniref:Uncharacterized protein n=1 Tax=Hibiscus sabdariffa TaxID=183260 RepID=A0ABR2QF79_9ROSI
MMHFSIVEVKFASHELAEVADLNELVDFIVTAQATIKLMEESKKDSLRPFKSNSCKSVNKFLYGIEPELVSTRSFSTFNRNEGHVHNLPTENMFHILPRPPLTIQDINTKR